MKAFISCVAFWLCCANNLTAQTDNVFSRELTMKNGLPADGINYVLQDSQGFIWLATTRGLCKFDGHRFTTFKPNPRSENSLSDYHTSRLWLDKNGRMWIGLSSGINLFDPKTEKFSRLWLDSIRQKAGISIYVRRFLERRDGKLLIGTSNGIYLADPNTLTVERFADSPVTEIRNIAETRDGSLWALATDSGVYNFNSRTGETVRYINDPNDPQKIERTGKIGSTSNAWGMLTDAHDRVWVGTQNGLELFNPKDASFTLYPLNRFVKDMVLNPNGKIWLATEKESFEFDPETGKYKVISPRGFTMTIFTDSNQSAWFANYHGLQQISRQRKKFEAYDKYGSVIASIVEDTHHDFWIFSATKISDFTLYRVDPTLQILKSIPDNPADRHGFKELQSLFTDDEGQVWIGHDSQFERYSQQNSTSWKVPAFKGPTKVLVDSFGAIWYGRFDGVKKLDLKTGKSEWVDFFPGSMINSVVEDSNHNLWFGLTAGLMRYNLLTRRQDLFKSDAADPQSLSSDVVYYITKDKEGSIWLGSEEGLSQMISGTENSVPRFKHWSTANSELPENGVFCIVDGLDGTFWLACGNKISHYDIHQNSFKNYDTNDGLLGWNFRPAAVTTGNGLRSDDGRIFFGSRDGFVVFHPDSVKDNPIVPPVVITEFSIHNKPVPVKGTDADTLAWETPLAQNISYTDEMVLTYEQNDFSFEFSALNYVNQESNQYKYKLEPYEKDWITASSANRVARYTNIGPGEYTFRVIGSNDDGVWNNEGATLTITITPPWWKTWWAYISYSLMGIGLLTLARRNIVQQERLKSNLALAKVEQEREHFELEKAKEVDKVKTSFFTNISHEFRTPITLLLGPLKEMYNKAASTGDKNTIGTMLRNGQRLLGLINQLLDLSKLEAGKMVLHASSMDVVQLMKEITSSYESLALDKKIKYTFYPEVKELNAFVDQEKVEKIVHNVLSNAFKFTPEGGEVLVHLKMHDNDWFQIIVKDSGIGIPVDQQTKIFDRFYQVDSSKTRNYEGSGLGMALTKELVELHHGKISVASEIGSGTTFTVQLPVSKKHFAANEIVDATEQRQSVQQEGFVTPLPLNEEVVEAEPGLNDEQPVLLIVEDNPDMRGFIRKILSDTYQILEAANGQEGLDKAVSEIPDLIISDIMMPQMDGYELCEKIKSNELTSHVPVILLTAKADRDSKIAGLQTGADDYLSKPFDAEELKLIVRNRILEITKLRDRFSKEVTLEPRKIAITSLDEKFLTKVMSVIETRMEDELFSIEELASEVGYSNMHLYRKIKALAGQTPSVFLRTIRLKRAAELLASNSDNVTQIAYSVGFSSLSYFTKCFKDQFGVTPGQYAETQVSKG